MASERPESQIVPGVIYEDCGYHQFSAPMHPSRTTS